ncbi:MAG: flagellar protein FlgN [Rhodospirillales bacterium]|nr:flagellar protein FlgN [Rhodospirillales bacterium]
MDINKRLSELIAISGQLADVLEQENAALTRYERGSLPALLEEKTRLGRAYESRMETLGDDPAAMAEADPDLGGRLREIGARVRDLIERNARLLKIAIEANRRVVDLIAEAVKSSAPGPAIYGVRGRKAAAAAGARGAPKSLPITLDRSL